MINLLDFLQDAESVESRELRIVSGQRPVMKAPNGWHPIAQEVLTPSFVREQVLALLEEEDRIKLLETGLVSGCLVFKNKNYEYVFSVSDQGINAYFNWKNEEVSLAQFHLPPAVPEIFKKATGVNLITGPRQSGRSTLAQLMAKDASQGGRRSIAVFADRTEEYEAGSQNGQWQSFAVETLAAAPQILKGFDFILIDSQRPQAWRSAIYLGELGFKVLLILPYLSTSVAMERLSEKIEASAEIGRRRLSEVVQTALSLRLVPALGGGVQAAYELLMLTKEIRSELRLNNWEKIEQLMTSVGENTGMRTLNQSLINLMMRRKIDIKAGFAESPRPDELDSMLEKVGF